MNIQLELFCLDLNVIQTVGIDSQGLLFWKRVVEVVVEGVGGEGGLQIGQGAYLWNRYEG